MSIGVVGYGRLGASLAARLRAQGHVMDVYCDSETTPTPDAYETVPSPRALLDRSTSIILLCPDNAQRVETLLNGREGLLGDDLEGRLIVDCCLHDRETAIALHDQVKAAGGRYLEAPVVEEFKATPGAELSLWVSGDKPDYEDAAEMLSALASHHEFVGGPGEATRRLSAP
ncbi:NAD(P)-binding domain-containing protein [Marinobacteraceae bacterium S3BR75-40.1]